MVSEIAIMHKWARSDVRSWVASEILRCAQNDSSRVCHSERSEESLDTYGESLVDDAIDKGEDI